jgi:hypothetical protein
MNDGLPWLRVILMLGLLAAMFGFPVITLTLDARRARCREIEAAGDTTTRQE